MSYQNLLRTELQSSEALTGTICYDPGHALFAMPFSLDHSTAARDLAAGSIPYLVWYEHALRPYGVKTAVFDLHVLVTSVHDASAHLQKSGWVRAPPRSDIGSNPAWDDDAEDHNVLVLGDIGRDDDRIVLLSKDDWGHPRPSSADPRIPELVDLYAGLARRFLAARTDEFREYLGVLLGYLSLYCPKLSSAGFLETLPADIQQFYLDWRSGTLVMLAPETIEHQRRVVEQVKEGAWSLMPEGSAAVGGIKRDREREDAVRRDQEKRLALSG